MKSKLLIGSAIFLLAFGTSCYKSANTTLLQQKGKEKSTVLQLLQQIDSVENLGEIDFDALTNFIDSAKSFSNKYPEDPMTPEFLYRSGLIAMTIAKASNNFEETKLFCKTALVIFDDIQMIYPDFNGVKNCILNKGVIYEDILHDFDNAEIFYREFIAKYPTDTLAINIESYLPYLGKSPEEIMSKTGK